ncbi:MAG: hypothetical protein ACM3SY_13700 [Candidatus Omnitrophota bacterium]
MPDEKVIEEIEEECQQIDKLFEEFGTLLDKIKDRDPDFIEIASLAMMLHSFYNGLENIFGRIAKRIDKTVPDGRDWHNELLTQMSKPTPKRKYAVLSEGMRDELKEYLGFRHFTRHAYPMDLDWDLMKDLVLRSDDVKERALIEINAFLKK